MTPIDNRHVARFEEFKTGEGLDDSESMFQQNNTGENSSSMIKGANLRVKEESKS